MASYAFIGLGTLTGSWNPATNSGSLASGLPLERSGSGDGGSGLNIFSNASPAEAGTTCGTGNYHKSSNLTASVGDYWEVTNNASFTLDDSTSFTELDWVIWDGTEWQRISNSDKIGSVLIGNLDNELKVITNDLEIEGDLKLEKTTGEVELRLQSSDKYSTIMQNNSAELIIQNASDGPIIFYDDTAERMRIDNDGKIGIGAATPSELLHLKSSTSAKPVLLIENTNDDAVASELKFLKSTTDEAAKDDIGIISFYGNDAANSVSQMAWILGENWTVDSGAEEGALHFGVASAGANSVSTLSLVGQGTAKTTYAVFGDPWEGNTTTYVGIGVAAPAKHLHIHGASGEVELRIQSDDSYSSILQNGNNDELTFQNASGGPILFYDDTAERMRITNGRVGIGDSSPDALLDLQGTATTGVPTLIVDHDDTDQIAISVAAANIDANVIDITADAVTTANVINISADGLTTGNALYIEDNSASTSAREMVYLYQKNTATGGSTPLFILHEGSGSYPSISIDRNFTSQEGENSVGLKVDTDVVTYANSTSAQQHYGAQIWINNEQNKNASPSGAGWVTGTGVYANITGSSYHGTQTCIGANLVARGADTNIGLQVQTDGPGGVPGSDDYAIKCLSPNSTANWFAVQVADDGVTTLSTLRGSGTDADLTIDTDGDIILKPNPNGAANGSVLPHGDGTMDFGSASKRWANVYTSDLHLKNDRGDWTIIEEENDLTIKNNKTNKMYRFKLEEIEN